MPDLSDDRPRPDNASNEAPPSSAGERELQILRAAGTLIDEEGFEGFTTTAIAQRAGISTATLYRHFRDKHAVLRALFHDLRVDRARHIGPFYTRIDGETDWRRVVDQLIRLAYRLRISRSGGQGIRAALQGNPELRALDQQQNREIAQRFSGAFTRRKPDMTQDTADIVGMVAVTITAGLLDATVRTPFDADRIVDECISVLQKYLAAYLD